MLEVNYIVLLFCLIGHLEAEYCTHDGDGKVCLIPSDSANQIDHGELLRTIAAELNVNDTVRIDIEISHLYLTKNVSFNKLNSLTINRDPSSLTTINCTGSDGDTGIIFTGIMNITLSNLELISCGSKSQVRKKWYSSALTVQSCGDLHFTNLIVSKSQGIGLMILNHLKGKVHVVLSNFKDNRISQHEIYGGGGVYIGEFEHNSPLSVQFEFEHCIFERNVAHTRHYHRYYTDEFGNSQTGHGQGGGVFLAFERNITQGDVRVFFSHCTFTENQAFLGGGLSVKIGAGTTPIIITKIIMTVENSVFKLNGCNKTMNNQWHARLGGGVSLSYYSIKSPNSFNGSEYHFRNVNFTGNCADLGGGVYFFSFRQASSNNLLQFESCKFKKNEAHIGSAVDLIPSNFVKLSAGEIPVPVFRNCTFLENFVYYNNDSRNTQRATGIGTLYASLYDVKFEQVNRFENNSGTGVYMVNGVADFSNSSAIFRNNRGIRGGAIALIGASAMIVGTHRDYKFEKNQAHFQGGAIYVLMINNHDFTVSRSCFIQYFDGSSFKNTRDWNTNIIFTENKAQVGHAIFATSLHPCQAINNNTEEDEGNPFFVTVKTSDVFAVRGISINERQIATEGAQLYYNRKALHMIPGKQYHHGVELKDDTNQTVNEPLRTNIYTRNTSTTVSLDPAFSLYVREKIQLNGTPGDQADLLLQTVSNRQSYTILQVILEECPPGFKLENNVCACNSNDYFGLTECDMNDFFSYLIPGLWIGKITEGNVTELATSICPHSFCNNDQTVRGVALPQKRSELDRSMCGESREGTLCGTCRSRYTSHFHSPKFQCWLENNLCKIGWLFYILSELAPVTVVFIIVIVFNISFTSGAVNGFILFSQVLLSLNIDASGIITFPNQKSITEGYQFLYGFLNLDFFTTDTMSFCLWPNATALDMLAFKYITIIYALSLVILVIWFMNKCGGRCLGRWWRITTVKSSIIHGISAFFIICYSQSIMVSHNLVTGGKLWLKEGSNITVSRRVWLNGNIVHFSREHLRYALPALFCLLTIGIIPPVLLLIYPLSNKVLALLGYEESRIVTYISQKLPINTLKPILDSFQGCFKDNLRFFAGFYFLYRWMAPIVYSTAPSLGTAYIITEILLILMLATHAFSQPYMKRVHNMVDTILFTDLLLINSITCIHYFLFQSQENRYTVKQKVATTSIIQAVLIYLPFTIMAIYVLVMGYIRVSHHSRNIIKYTGEGGMEENSSTAQTLRRLRAAVQSFSSVNGDISVQDDEELPHRLIAGQLYYKHFEDTEYAQEMHADPQSAKNALTY